MHHHNTQNAALNVIYFRISLGGLMQSIPIAFVKSTRNIEKYSKKYARYPLI